MSLKKMVLCTVMVLLSVATMAHEDHGSALAKSLHGGVVKKSVNSYVEVVQDENIEIYVTDHTYKNIVSPKLVINGVAEIKGKVIPLKLEIKNSHFIVLTDLKKEKHFKLKVSLKIESKAEEVVFHLEN
jgi:hypothetical protein